jgi:hypothetical protein
VPFVESLELLFSFELVADRNHTYVVAQNPDDFEKLDVLDDTDRNVIRYERAHRWSHPLTLYVTIFLCSVGAAVQYDPSICPRGFPIPYLCLSPLCSEAGIKRDPMVPVCLHPRFACF